ncbi:hypothetical protein IMZ48_08545 [Candidatus Bathyarchaeota archaeon]|nr:hypothetical protein [Candidatus Bathyarchaeota archaeon]
MSDSNVATKAPESDAQEELTPQTSPSPGVGECCVTDRPARTISSHHMELTQLTFLQQVGRQRRGK